MHSVVAEFADRGGGPDTHRSAWRSLDRRRRHPLARARTTAPARRHRRWNGTWLWRGVTHGERFLTGRSMIMAGHSEQKFVCYPIGPSDAARRRGSLINWVAELRYAEHDATEREDWNKRGELDDFLPRFESWRFDWLDVPG